MAQRILITGSSGLVGSTAVTHFDRLGHHTVGIDNNLRADFFGSDGDTLWNLRWLQKHTRRFEQVSSDIRDRQACLDIVKQHRPNLIIHCAAQPSHDLAAKRPFIDFDVNAVGTLNLLEATRRYVKDSSFIFLSSNKVYGDVPNEFPLQELDNRYDYSRREDYYGISESCRIDQCLHSLFGVSKTAADILTQEYGRYFDMPTVCFRLGCITGDRHSSVKAHGFLSYLVKCFVRRDTYTILGYKGKQVRDQIHANDVVRAIEAYYQSPRAGEVYNLGGGRENNASILECIEKIEDRLNYRTDIIYSKKNRSGDHKCYISDTRKFSSHYPQWQLSQTIDDILDEMIASEFTRLNGRNIDG